MTKAQQHAGFTVKDETIKRLQQLARERDAAARELTLEGEAAVRLFDPWKTLDESGAALVALAQWSRTNPDKLNEQGLRERVEKQAARLRADFEKRAGFMERHFGVAKRPRDNATESDLIRARETAERWHRIKGTPKGAQMILSDFMEVVESGSPALVDTLLDEAEVVLDDPIFTIIRNDLDTLINRTRASMRYTGHYSHEFSAPLLSQARVRYQRLEKKVLDLDIDGVLSALRQRDAEGFMPLVVPREVGIHNTDLILKEAAPQLTAEARPTPSTRLRKSLLGQQGGSDDE